MNDEIPNSDEKRAVERWENEGGKCVLSVMNAGSTAHECTIKTKRKGLVQ